MTSVSRLGLASAILILAGCTSQSSTSGAQTTAAAPAPAAPAAAPAPAAPAAPPAPAAPVPAAPAPQAAAPAAPQNVVGGLPAGPNRELTRQLCSACHDVSNFTGQRHTREEWAGIVASMSTGASAADDAKVVEYLTTVFGR